MADVPACEYSKREIVTAGRVLAGSISELDARSGDVLNAFKIARSWREASAYPMRRVRAELIAKMRQSEVKGTTAARLKRMVSIRKKLRETPLSLYQMQDIGGCRLIVDSISDIEIALRPYLEGSSRYRIIRDDDLLQSPHPSGYRSRHLTLKFEDQLIAGFDRHFVEVQFRTRKQHSWATAVEAIGLVRKEDLKGGIGHPDWLRLFQIMAAELSDDEGGGQIPSVLLDPTDRRKELQALEKRINAVRTLDSYNRAIRHTERIYSFSAPYYLIEYDMDRMEVSVRPFSHAAYGSERYAASEADPNINSVLVEVDKVADLREAYPNYFLDVGAFLSRLKKALRNDAQSPVSLDWITSWPGWKSKSKPKGM